MIHAHTQTHVAFVARVVACNTNYKPYWAYHQNSLSQQAHILVPLGQKLGQNWLLWCHCSHAPGCHTLYVQSTLTDASIHPNVLNDI